MNDGSVFRRKVYIPKGEFRESKLLNIDKAARFYFWYIWLLTRRRGSQVEEKKKRI
jgi:hypothetical protein